MKLVLDKVVNRLLEIHAEELQSDMILNDDLAGELCIPYGDVQVDRVNNIITLEADLEDWEIEAFADCII